MSKEDISIPCIDGIPVNEYILKYKYVITKSLSVDFYTFINTNDFETLLREQLGDPKFELAVCSYDDDVYICSNVEISLDLVNRLIETYTTEIVSLSATYVYKPREQRTELVLPINAAPPRIPITTNESSSTMTNKTMMDMSNNVAANYLTSSTGFITINSTSPVNGSVLVSDGASSASWERLVHTKLGDGGVYTHSQIDTHLSASNAHGVTSAIVGVNDAQTLTNKILTSRNNTITCDSFRTSTGSVSISSSANPAIGDSLVASSTSVASWAKVNHSNLSNIGTYTHSQLDSHVNDTLLHIPTTVTGVTIAKGSIPVRSSGTAWSYIPVGTNSQVLTCDSTTSTGLSWTTPTPPGTTLPSGYGTWWTFSNTQSRNTTGGAFLIAGFATYRPINRLDATSDSNSTLVSLSSNVLTFKTGSYRITASVSVNRMGRAFLQFTDVSDGSIVCRGVNSNTSTSSSGNDTILICDSVVKFTTNTNVRMDIYGSSANTSTAAFGTPMNISGYEEVYSTIFIQYLG